MARTKQFNTRYSPEFKISVILDMREHNLGYRETMRKYFPDLDPKNFNFIKQWERIYLEEGEAGFYLERRGRQTKMENPKKGRPRKKPLPPDVEEDLIAENQRLKEQLEYLQMENEYLKKLDALVRKEAQQKGKKRK
jgi:transposase